MRQGCTQAWDPDPEGQDAGSRSSDLGLGQQGAMEGF